MNILSSLLKWIGNVIGANPSTLTTTSKTLVGAINEVDSDVSGKVSKSGDTMTGRLNYKRSAVDTTQTNNGVTANNDFSSPMYRDVNDRYTGYIDNVAYSSGNVGTAIFASNYDSSGNRKNNYLYIIVAKDGTQTYQVANPSAFRSAISVSDIRSTTVYKSVTLSANEQSSVTLTYSLPSGATIMSISLSQVPNPNWVYAAINSHNATQTVIAYHNTYSGSITGYFEVMIMYKV